MEREPILAMRNLRHEFSSGPWDRRGLGAQVLRGVDLDLHPGESLALVGESGAGKTTLVRALLRLFQPSGGTVLFRGRDVLTMAPKDLNDFRTRVQVVFQDPFGSLNPRQRVGRMLGEVLRVHDGGSSSEERGKRVDELLGLVDLPAGAARRFPHEFSGGQRQRLSIARALAVEPEILILDEPVSALDLSVQAQILNLLEDLQSALALTYLLVSHDLSVVRHVADRVAVMYLGRVVEEASSTQFFSDPLHPYAQALLAAADPSGWGGRKAPSEREWVPLDGETPSPFHPPTGCALNPRCPHPSKDSRCRAEDPPLRSVEKGRQVACWKARKQPVNP